MKVIIFGATGSAGGSVLRVCLATPAIDEVRALVRRPMNIVHDKLHAFLHRDFLNYDDIKEAFAGIDACFFCLGVSAVQVSTEEEYRRITHDFALSAAHALKASSPHAIFHFISGQSTRSDSRFMWARVKAETERDLIALLGANCYRPAFIEGELSDASPRFMQALRPAFRLLRPFRHLYVHGHDLGRAMLQATIENMRGRVFENAEIRELANRHAGKTQRR